MSDFAGRILALAIRTHDQLSLAESRYSLALRRALAPPSHSNSRLGRSHISFLLVANKYSYKRSLQITDKSHGQTKVEYVVADLSLISGMKACVKDVEDRLAGKTIDHIIESQGGPTNGVYRPTTEGLDVYFSTETLSRFAIPYLLLSSGLLSPTASLVLICQPSGSTKKLPKEITVDLGDLDLGRKALRGEWGRGMKDVFQSASNTGLILDSVVLELNDRYLGISANHVFPGILPTFSTMLPFPSLLFSSPASLTLLNSSPTSG